MADFSGCHFIFGGKPSRDYGLYFANADTDRMTSLYGERKGEFIYNKKIAKRMLIDDDYSDSYLTFDVEILTDNDRCLNTMEQKEIVNWLFYGRGFKPLFIDLQDDRFAETYDMIDGKMYKKYLNCRFINPEKMEYNGGIVGYKATLEADSHMFWQEPITKEYTFVWDDPAQDNQDIATNQDSQNITIDVDTDWDGYIYPKVTITTNPDAYISNSQENEVDINEVDINIVKIKNITDDPDRLTSFANAPEEITVQMNGDTNYIDEDYYQRFRDRNFIRLLRGENTINVNNCVSSIKITYSQRKVL